MALLAPPLVYISALPLSFLPFFVAGPPPLLPECWNVPRANAGKRPAPLEKPVAPFVDFFQARVSRYPDKPWTSSLTRLPCSLRATASEP